MLQLLAAMDSFRKWLYKPRRDDTSHLAQFFYADEALNLVAAELDSFDGRKEPERCTSLVSHLRHCQDKVLNICSRIMDEMIPNERAERDFRVKFPDDVLQDNLAGQLWFGAECLAAGSSIMNREIQSVVMRPLAKKLTKSLEEVRGLLREAALRSPHGAHASHLLYSDPAHADRLVHSLRVFDRLLAKFELSYVSAMVPVKTALEYEVQQCVVVLFSETLQRGLRTGLLSQDQVDQCDPALMFTIPRLAIVAGLLVFPHGPLSLSSPELMSDMFRPFRQLLLKIRELLWTLSESELQALEKMLCSSSDPTGQPPGGRGVSSHAPSPSILRCEERTDGGWEGGRLEVEVEVDGEVGVGSSRWVRTIPCDCSTAQGPSTDQELAADQDCWAPPASASPPLSVPSCYKEKNLSSSCLMCNDPSASPNSNCSWSGSSSETSSYDSECRDEVEVALAVRAAEINSSSQARARFKSSEDLLQRLFVCISGVADQLQTNFAGDLRNILKAVFLINASEPPHFDSPDNRPSGEYCEEGEDVVGGLNAGDVTGPPQDSSGDSEWNGRSSPRSGVEWDGRSSARGGVEWNGSPPNGVEWNGSPPNGVDWNGRSSPPGGVEWNGRSGSPAGGVEWSGRSVPPPWVPDEEAPSCMACTSPFTVIRRRHHCRNCGMIFCARCSSNSVPLPKFGHMKPVRVCNRCFIYHVTPFTLDPRHRASPLPN